MRALNLPLKHARYSTGFTLVEILVALIVLSIGMLGIAALYLETLRANRSAMVRTQAVALASDLADRIRANRVPAGTYSGGGLNALATSDLTNWQETLAERLPGGAGEVRYRAGTTTTPSMYTIIVAWTEIGQDDPVTYELRLEL